MASERTLKMLRRISGARLRRSMRTNAVSSTSATATSPSVRPEPQPQACAWTIA